MDGIDHEQRRIGSAVLGRRGAGWRPQRSPASAEGRGPTAHARQWADDEVRADPSDCAEAIPDRRARRRARGEDDARADGGESRRGRANRNPSLRQLLAAFAPRASRPQPQDRYPGVASCEVRPKFQTGQAAARARQSRGSWGGRRHGWRRDHRDTGVWRLLQSTRAPTVTWTGLKARVLPRLPICPRGLSCQPKDRDERASCTTGSKTEPPASGDSSGRDASGNLYQPLISSDRRTRFKQRCKSRPR